MCHSFWPPWPFLGAFSWRQVRCQQFLCGWLFCRRLSFAGVRFLQAYVFCKRLLGCRSLLGPAPFFRRGLRASVAVFRSGSPADGRGQICLGGFRPAPNASEASRCLPLPPAARGSRPWIFFTSSARSAPSLPGIALGVKLVKAIWSPISPLPSRPSGFVGCLQNDLYSSPPTISRIALVSSGRIIQLRASIHCAIYPCLADKLADCFDKTSTGQVFGHHESAQTTPTNQTALTTPYPK